MHRTHKFYKVSDASREFIKKRDGFKFDEVNLNHKTVILIAGREGSGKTHLAS